MPSPSEFESWSSGRSGAPHEAKEKAKKEGGKIPKAPSGRR